MKVHYVFVAAASSRYEETMAARSFLFFFASLISGAATVACGSSGSRTGFADGSGGAAGTGGIGGVDDVCDTCSFGSYVPCGPNGKPTTTIPCDRACTPGVGCTQCVADGLGCMGNEVHECNADGTLGALVETCDVGAGLTCTEGGCRNACEVAADAPSNVGCEFWAADLDQQDGFNDPASMPWGIVLSNTGDSPANVTVEQNDAQPGEPVSTSVAHQITVSPGELRALILPTRELDCGVRPNDYGSPGTCLSSRAFRVVSSAPLVVYQFNVFENAFSNDASLLLPTNALGKVYRIVGWPAGHPAFLPIFNVIDRSYVTIVGVTEGTQVRVSPSWRIRGNPPIGPTQPGGLITVELGPFDVLNLETDDATLQESALPGVADLTGTVVDATAPVAVFSGVESTSAPYHVDIPTPPGWMDDSCCLDHLEEQMFPLESLGRTFLVTRSPVRSTGSFTEPDVLRFVGAAAETTVTTTLDPPFDTFTLQPGEVRDTWTDRDITVTATEPLLIGQLLVSQGYVDGPLVGDPALTVFPPVEQHRAEYIFLTPSSWTENWVVIGAPVDATVTIDGSEPSRCTVVPIGDLEGTEYEARRCPLQQGAHHLSGDHPFGIVAYGYGSAGSYAFAGGADVKPIYEPPPVF